MTTDILATNNTPKQSATQTEPQAQLQTQRTAAINSKNSDRTSHHTNLNTPTHALSCKLAKVKTEKASALSIRVDAFLEEGSNKTLSSLSQHADILNAQLACLRATVRIDPQHHYYLSFQGIAQASITADSVSQFLSALTDDLGIFLAYAKTYELSLCEGWLQPYLDTSESIPHAVCYKVALRQ